MAYAAVRIESLYFPFGTTMLSTTAFRWNSQYFFGFFFSYGVYLPFWAIWLKSQGIAPSDIGLVVGLAFATRCVANLLFTPRIHRVEQLVPALRFLSIAGAVVLALHGAAQGSLLVISVATVLFNLCIGPIVPLQDSLTNYYAKLNVLDYGKTRLWGSIAFIVGSTVVGWCVNFWGEQAILYTAVLGMLALFVISLRGLSPSPEGGNATAVQRPKLLSVMREKRTIKFLSLIALIQGSHAAYYSFSSIYWQSVGYTEDVIGYLWSIGVVAEIVIFAFSRRLFSSWAIQTMFMVSAVGVIVRWGLTASTHQIVFVVVIQMLHAVTFAIAHFAAIRYIQAGPARSMVSLQAMYNAIPLGAFIALMTSVSGWGYEIWGVKIFWLMAAMGVAALFIRLDPPNDCEVEKASA
jgi:PPP family 3-phenylpropionic acid transporter